MTANADQLAGKFLVQDHFPDGRPGPSYQVCETRAEAEAVREGFGSNATISRVRGTCEDCGSPLRAGDGSPYCLRGCR